MADSTTARTVPMKVLCVGFGRTGTISLRESLIALGYRNPYHTFDAINHSNYDCKLWADMLKAKAAGNPPGRADFDRILGNSQAVLDMPAAHFVEELMEAYPDAKVILTVREYNSWYKSVTNTLRVWSRSYVTTLVEIGDFALFMPTRHMHSMFHTLDRVLYDNDFDRNNRRAYEEHNAHVKAIVSPDRLLVYHPGDGWEPLCKFLGRPMPEDQAVNANNSEDFNKTVKMLHRGLLMAQAKRILDVTAYAALTATVVGAVLRRFPSLRTMVGY